MFDSNTQKAWDYLQKKRGEQGNIHLKNYFLEISRTMSFSNRIQELRRKYSIPPEGFSKTDNTEYWKWSEKYNKKYSKQVFTDIYRLCEKFFLPKEWWKAIMEALFHNSEDINDIGFGSTPGLCIISNERKRRNKSYPISIEISPYASKRDILDFVSIVYKNEIEPKQKKYQLEACKIGKVKSRNIETQRRNDFIYKHRNLTIKEIRVLLAKKKIFLDDGHISKIRSLEIKKRNDV